MPSGQVFAGMPGVRHSRGMARSLTPVAASLLALLGLGLGPVACLDAASRYTVTVHVVNPDSRAFEGSGGALGAGLEVRAQLPAQGGLAGLEDNQPLVVDDACQGRHCGEPAATEPGRCGVQPRRVAPGGTVNLDWDGRYFPRRNDPFGPCLGPAQVVPEGTGVILTLCGRLQVDPEDLGNAPLICEDHSVTVGDPVQLTVELVVPGAVALGGS